MSADSLCNSLPLYATRNVETEVSALAKHIILGIYIFQVWVGKLGYVPGQCAVKLCTIRDLRCEWTPVTH